MAEQDNLDDEDILGLDDEDELDSVDPDEDALLESTSTSFFTRKRLLIVVGVILAVGILVGILLFSRSGNSVQSQSPAVGAQYQQKPAKKKEVKKNRKIKYDILFRQLDGRQLSSVLRELSFEGIAFDVKQAGKQFDLYVDREKMEEAKNLLAVKGLPTGGARGYEIFDEASNLGVTEFDKRIRLVRALSGQMEKAIMKFEDIDTAQVEIVIPEPRLFAVTQPPVTASILIKKAYDGAITDELVYAIIQMVSNGVESLQPENISVVDTQGRVLSDGVLSRIAEKKRQELLEMQKYGKLPVEKLGRQGQAVVPEIGDVVGWFALKAQYESLLEKKAHEQLKGVLPEGSYKVAVTVDLNNTSNMETPDVKRLTASIVVDSAKEDIDIEDSIQIKQIQNTVAGAIGYVRGRDMILVSKAEFAKPVEVAKKEVKKEKKTNYFAFLKTYYKYWPIPAMGFPALALLYLLYRGLRRVFLWVARRFGFFNKSDSFTDEVEIQEDDEDPVLEDIFQEEAPSETSGDESKQRLLEIASAEPDKVLSLIEEWMQEEEVLA